MVSVVIPALNEAAVIAETVRAVSQVRGVGEIIVVDGGSVDATLANAANAGAKAITAARGRGAQLAAGAEQAAGDVLWFLHADTAPPPEAGEHILAALRNPGVAGGNFAIEFDGVGRGAALLTRFYPHLGRLGLCYGDSGFFARRGAYEAAGGFRAYPIFEDLDLLGRLRRKGRFVHLDCALRVSGRRWRQRGFALVFLRWTALQVLYWVGVPPRHLARFYPQIR